MGANDQRQGRESQNRITDAAFETNLILNFKQSSCDPVPLGLIFILYYGSWPMIVKMFISGNPVFNSIASFLEINEIALKNLATNLNMSLV
jgi:hypothetical protein